MTNNQRNSRNHDDENEGEEDENDDDSVKYSTEAIVEKEVDATDNEVQKILSINPVILLAEAIEEDETAEEQQQILIRHEDQQDQ